MDFLRVTRWLELREVLKIEWELFLEWDCRVVMKPEAEPCEGEDRWVNGLEVCCMS